MGSMNGTFNAGHFEESQGACSQGRDPDGISFHLQFVLFYVTPRNFQADGEERNPSSGTYFQIL